MMEQYTAQQSSRPSLEVSQSVGGREGKKLYSTKKGTKRKGDRLQPRCQGSLNIYLGLYT